jgi:predicted HTH domain antitoxin
MLVTIYYLEDPITNEIRYIGRTKNDLKARLRGHLATAKKNKFKTKKDNWILKLYNLKLKPIIKPILQIEGWTESYLKEQALIKYHIDREFNLVNLHDRGEGHLLRNISDEQKKKISDTVKLLHKQGVYDSRGKKITLYNLEGYKIQSFKNARLAAEYIGVSLKHIENCLKRNDKRLHDFQVRREDQDKIERYIYENLNKIPMPTINPVNCLENPEEDNQQPSSCGNTEKGSTTSSESLVDNNSTTKAGQPMKSYKFKLYDFTKKEWSKPFSSVEDIV